MLYVIEFVNIKYILAIVIRETIIYSSIEVFISNSIDKYKCFKTDKHLFLLCESLATKSAMLESAEYKILHIHYFMHYTSSEFSLSVCSSETGVKIA